MLPDPVRSVKAFCPHCGARIELVVDGSAGSQQYVEDCSVCCRPMVVSLQVHTDDSMSVEVRSEDA